MVINTNIAAQSAAASLTNSSNLLAQSLQRLSSGSKIVSPADDSAGLAVATKLNAQVARVGAAQNNVANAISFAQTQDGYLQQVSTALTRMSELTIAAQDPTKTDSDRALYNEEFNSLSAFVGGIASKTFNGVSLFSANSLSVTTDGEGSAIALAPINLNSISYTTLQGDHVDIIGNSGTGAVYAMNDVQRVISQLAQDRATIGSNLEALNYYSSTMTAVKTNLTAASSQLTDVNVAQESTNYARQNILVQSGTAMLAQANAIPQSVLKLLA